MEYKIEKTELFEAWFSRLDFMTVSRIEARLDRVKQGNFGDYKQIDNSLFELRFFFGAGYRVYYCFRDGVIVLLLNGGDKSSQKKDISKAKALLAELE